MSTLLTAMLPPTAAGGFCSISAGSALGPNDVWMVSHRSGPPGLLHWDGTSWTFTAKSPVVRLLSDIVAVASDDVWSVRYGSGWGVETTLTEHWDGSSWAEVPSPNPVDGECRLWGCDASAADDVWAVGCSAMVDPISPVGALFMPLAARRTLILHWNGAQWELVRSPNKRHEGNGLVAVGAVDRREAWDVGWYQDSGRTNALLLHWYHGHWRIAENPTGGQLASGTQ
jgi:hypothetical protein